MDERMHIDGETFVSAVMEGNVDSLTHWGIKGMKWGVRRYQNEDGSLTEAGSKRYAQDQRANAGKKKGDKIGAADPERWVQEDMSRTKNIANESSSAASKAKNISDIASRRSLEKRKSEINLDHMSDKEMRDKINRELLERQYRDVFTPKNTSRGKEYLDTVLEYAVPILSLTGTAVGIALEIRRARNGG